MSGELERLRDIHQHNEVGDASDEEVGQYTINWAEENYPGYETDAQRIAELEDENARLASLLTVGNKEIVGKVEEIAKRLGDDLRDETARLKAQIERAKNLRLCRPPTCEETIRHEVIGGWWIFEFEGQRGQEQRRARFVRDEPEMRSPDHDSWTVFSACKPIVSCVPCDESGQHCPIGGWPAQGQASDSPALPRPSSNPDPNP